jgi:hypothetical protein
MFSRRVPTLLTGWGDLHINVSCKIVLLDFVDRINYKIITFQRFEGWILLPASDKKDGKRIERLSVELLGWASHRPGPGPGQPGCPTDRLPVLFPPFFPWRRKQNPAFETLQFYNLDYGQSPEEDSNFYL